MELVIEDMDPELLDLDRLSRGLTRLTQQVPEADDITVVLTPDFVRSIRSRTGDPAYSAERTGGMGVAAAMTLPQKGNECAIVISAAFFVSGDDIEEMDGARVLAHEGWHAALHQRGEETHDIRTRLRLGDGLDGTLHAMAGVAVGEYRVERSLCNEGWWPLAASADQLLPALESLDTRIARATNAGTNRANRVRKVVTSDLHEFLHTRLAYVAAEDLASDHTRLPIGLFQTDVWREYLGDFWPSLLACLERVPGADVETSLTTMDDLVADLAAEIGEWLAQLQLSPTSGEG